MTLKIAIAGAGNVARQSYLPYLARRADVQLSYYSRTRERAEACARDFGGWVANSPAELIAADPDAVLLLTLETQRYEAALALLEHRPRRVFFEKPLVAQAGQASVTEEDFYLARSLLARARAAGTETAMVFNYRFFEQTRRAQELIRTRGFGKLTQAALFVNYACWSHSIDLLALFGGPPAQISALSGAATFQSPVDAAPAPDSAAAFLLQNGASGVILGTSASSFDHPLYEHIFQFERGSLRFSDLDGPLTVCDNAARYSETFGLIGHYSRWAQYGASFEKSLAAYLESIEQGAPPPIPGAAGLAELQFEAALRRSAARGRPVDVQSEFPLEEG